MTGRMRVRRPFGVARCLVVAAVLLGLVGSVVPSPARAATTTTVSALTGVQIQLGPEQRVVGPTSMMDSPYFAEFTAAGNVVGYLSNQTTYAYDAVGGRLSGGRVALSRGAAGSFDACGAWLNSVYRVSDTHWVGWYHAEAAGSDDGVCRNDGSTIWRVAYAESWDGGRTWQKPGYPNNVVIAQSPQRLLMAHPVGTDAGNPRVVRVGDYLYALYQATGTGATYSGTAHTVNIARAPLSSLGTPGSWKKYYCTKTLLGGMRCTWNEPGVGGLSSSVPNLPAMARFVSWNTYLGRFLGLQSSGRAGFSLRLSSGSDLLSWPSAAPIYPAVSTASDTSVDQWTGRTSSSKQLYGYPSLVGTYGGSAASGRVFYIYYMKVYEGDAFNRRFLFRRTVTLAKTSGTPYDRVRLTTYVDGAGNRRTTTEQPKDQALRPQRATGNLASSAHPGWNPVFECASGHGDAFLQGEACADGHPAIRRVGWIAPSRTAVATVPIYRCYDAARRRHFASTSSGCSGARTEFRMGFGLPTLS